MQFKMRKIIFVTTSPSVPVVQSSYTEFWSLQTFTGFQSTSRNHRVVVDRPYERYKAHSDLSQISRFARFSGFDPPGAHPQGAWGERHYQKRWHFIHTKQGIKLLGVPDGPENSRDPKPILVFVISLYIVYIYIVYIEEDRILRTHLVNEIPAFGRG